MSYVMEAKMMKKIHQMNMPSPIELSRYKEEMDAGKIIDDLINKCNKNPSNNDIRETLIPFFAYIEFNENASTQKRLLYHEFWKRQEDFSTTLFWKIFGWFYYSDNFNTYYRDEIRDALKVKDRMTIPLKTRMQHADWMIQNDQRMIIAKTTDQFKDEIKVYRGFLCRTANGERIRSSDDKNDPKYYMQQVGKGFGYFLNKKVAKKSATQWIDSRIVYDYAKGLIHLNDPNDPTGGEFAERIRSNMEHLKIETKMTEEQIIEKIKDFPIENYTACEFFKFVDDNPDHPISKPIVHCAEDIDRYLKETENNYDSEYRDRVSVRAVVATYTIKREDIIFASNKFDYEMEVVVLPENAKFMCYQFLTTQEIQNAT